jgi:hypothetical protein
VIERRSGFGVGHRVQQRLQQIRPGGRLFVQDLQAFGLLLELLRLLL